MPSGAVATGSIAVMTPSSTTTSAGPGCPTTCDAAIRIAGKLGGDRFLDLLGLPLAERQPPEATSGADEHPAEIELAPLERQPGRRRQVVMVVVQALARGEQGEHLAVVRGVVVRLAAPRVPDRVHRGVEHQVGDG